MAKKYMRIRGVEYKLKEEKGYPADELLYKLIRRLRTQKSNMKKTISEYTERIVLKEKYLNDIYDKFEQDFEKWQNKKKSTG